MIRCIRRLSYGNPKLTAAQISHILSGDQSISGNCHSASLASNRISEDSRFHQDIGDKNLFGVLDGHWSRFTSRFLKNAIPDTVKEISKKSSIPSDILSQSFNSIDTHLLDLPFNLLKTKSPKAIAMIDANTRLEVLEKAKISFSGSCALVAMVDNNSLTVANSGDCRAILGKHSDGKWATQNITNDHTPANPFEFERMVSEHPASEIATIAFKPTHESPMRVLGGMVRT
jgi:serine/threonine protein phosphatase PrpC